MAADAKSGDDARTGPDDLQVLVVEDSAQISSLVADLINEVAGVRVADSVASESEAIEVLERGNVDIVVLDLQLRTGTGFGVLRALGRFEKQPVVVVLTNFSIGAYRKAALAMGAREFLDKSRDYDRLSGILKEIAAARAT